MARKSGKNNLATVAVVSLAFVTAIVLGLLYLKQDKNILTPPTQNNDPTSVNSETIKICEDLNIDAQTAELQVSQDGEYLKIDYITPGLDDYTLTVAVYSLKENALISKQDFGTSDFQTGLLKNGYYVAKMSEKVIDFYDYKANKTESVTLPNSETIGCVAVSLDGQYICYAENYRAEICLFDKSDGRSTKICDYSGYTDFKGSFDDNFSILYGENTAMAISGKSGKCAKTDTKSRIVGLFDDTCVTADDKFNIYNLKDKTESSVAYNKIDETLLTAKGNTVITSASETDGDVLTVYNAEDNKYFTVKLSEVVFDGVVISENKIAVVTAKSYGEDFSILLVDCADYAREEITENSVKPIEDDKEAIVSEAEKTEVKKLINGVAVISQYPEFPTGCESVSAVIAMKYAGSKITVTDFVDNYLQKSSEFYTVDGVKYGPDPNEFFIGSPKSKSSFGCMAPVIEKAMNKFYGGSKKVLNLTGSNMDILCREYIDRDIPCLVWVSIGMKEPYYTRSWKLSSTNTDFTWLSNEHCMVLIGYDENNYYFSDPYSGAYVKYAKDLSEKRFEAFGKQAIAIK